MARWITAPQRTVLASAVNNAVSRVAGLVAIALIAGAAVSGIGIHNPRASTGGPAAATALSQTRAVSGHSG